MWNLCPCTVDLWAMQNDRMEKANREEGKQKKKQQNTVQTVVFDGKKMVESQRSKKNKTI